MSSLCYSDMKLLLDRFDAMDRKLNALLIIGEKIMAGMDTVVAELNALADTVTALEGAEASAVALLQGLKAALDAALAASDPTAALAAVAAIRDRLGTDTQSLANAVAANPLP